MKPFRISLLSKELRISLLLLLSITFLNCNDDNKEQEIIVPKIQLQLNVKLQDLCIKSENSKTGEIFHEICYKMEDMRNMSYAIHNAETGEYVQAGYNGTIENKIADGVYTDVYELSAGKYNITLIANIDKQIVEPTNGNDLVNSLSLDYNEAICQTGNSHVFYKTFEVEIIPSVPDKITKDIQLDIMSKGYFTYAISKESWSKAPEGAKIEIVAEVKNIPAVFYIKNGKTLTNKEHAQYQLEKYKQTVTLTEIKPSKEVLLYQILLGNADLEDTPEEKGSFVVTSKENGKEIKTYKEEMPYQGESNYFGYTIIDDIYANTDPKIFSAKE